MVAHTSFHYHQRRLAIVATALLTLLLSTAASAQTLFLHDSKETKLPDQKPEVAFQRRVEVDNPALLLDDTAAERLRLDLLSDTSIVAVRQRLIKTATGAIWMGSVDGYPDSSTTFTIENGALVSGAIYAVFGVFRVMPFENGFVLEQLGTTGETTETNRSTIIPFLEGTDVFWTLQKTSEQVPPLPYKTEKELAFPYKLEADIFPHLVVMQNFTDVLNISKQEAKGDARRFKEFAYAISGTPAVRVRMLRTVSAPVRRPSFMPRVNVQMLWVRGLKDCTNFNAQSKRDERCRPPTKEMTARQTTSDAPNSALDSLRLLSRVSIWEGHFIVGHHSNGQDGCLTTNQDREPPLTGVCIPEDAATVDNVNRVDGSFSTNYVRVGMNYSRNWMGGVYVLQAKSEARMRAEWEYHPRGWVDPAIVDLYGRSRWNLEGAYAMAAVPFCKKRLEGSIGLTLNPGAPEGVNEGTVKLQASCFPTVNGGWGFFVRYYNGQDYYNVGFFDNISRVQFGATFNQTGFFRFRRPVAKS